MALIDLSNFDAAGGLVQSSAGRSGNANGNIYFDVANGRIELITVGEQANIDLTSRGVGTAGVLATANVDTTWYKIVTIGTTDFTLFGAGSNTVGLVFQSTSTGGLGTGTMNECSANPLIEDDGVKMEALYAFEREQRRSDEVLRQYDFFFKGTFKFGGAYELVNGRKFDDADGSATSDTVDDRFKVRGSGWIERNTAGAIGRISYGVTSLGNIEALSQPYYQLSNGGAPINFDKDGPINEAIQVYGDNAVDANAYTTSVATAASQTITVVSSARTFTRSTGDYVADGFIVGHRFTAAGLSANTGTYTVESVTALVITVTLDPANLTTNDTGDGDEVLTVNGIDTRTFLSNKVRTYGQNPDEKQLGDSGVTQMDGYSSGFALGESPHLTTVPGTYPLADVYGGAQVSPWTGMGLEELDAAQTETGFTTADGDFTWVVNNTVPGNLNEVIAFLDALQQTDDDINDHVSNVTNGKRVGTWYSYDADGTIRFDSPFANEGLFIEQLVGTDKNRVAFVDDAGATKLYPAYSSVTVFVGADAVADANAWFHAFFLAGIGAQAGNDFNTATAITVQEPDTTLVKGNVDGTGLSVGNDILFEFDHAGDTIGGTAANNKDCVFECEGDGGVTAAKTIFTLTNAASIGATCQPAVETNV